MEEAITPPISAKKKIGTVNKAEKLQESNKTVLTPRSNKTEKINH